LCITDDQFRHLEYVHTRCLRRILRIKAVFYSRISNKEIRRKAKVSSIRVQVRKLQYDFLRTILLLPESHPLRLVVFEPGEALTPRVPVLPIPRAKCKVAVKGRPRGTWISILLPPLKDLYTVNEILQLAKDPHRWAHAISRLCSDAE
jgi:hypothetical protein